MVKKTRKVYRDSRTGEWTTKKNVKLHPGQTETERPSRWEASPS